MSTPQRALFKRCNFVAPIHGEQLVRKSHTYRNFVKPNAINLFRLSRWGKPAANAKYGSENVAGLTILFAASY